MKKYLAAFEDGTDRVFRNVGIENSDAGELPRIKHKTQFSCKKKLRAESFEAILPTIRSTILCSPKYNFSSFAGLCM